MNPENTQGYSPETAGRHIRTREQVAEIEAAAERAKSIRKIAERLGGVSIADTVERPDPEALARLSDRLEG